MNKISDIRVKTKAKDLCKYVMIITNKSPKHYRYTFVNRMQNYALDVVENLYRANSIELNSLSIAKRSEYQRQAACDIRLLCYVSMVAMEVDCILLKQYEQICKLASDIIPLIKAWMLSDKQRLQK